MSLEEIALFAGLALAYRWLVPAGWRAWCLMLLSAAAIYWLQPTLPIRYLDFALPTAALMLSVLVWWLTLPPGSRFTQGDALALGLLTALILGVAATRYLIPDLRPTLSRPPAPLTVLPLLLGVGVLAIGLRRLGIYAVYGGIIALVGLFIALKTEAFATDISRLLRDFSGQNTALSSPLDLTWLGFSYVAFRWLHTLFDRLNGRLPAVSLRDYVAYSVFFPAYPAGPIDWVERFTADMGNLPTLEGRAAAPVIAGVERIAIGLLKKFVLADSLALLALNVVNAEQATHTAGLWLLLYGYALRLYWDFSGYTDIAIGLGMLFGVRLPENFQQPYLKTNIAAFWQSWHITLSNWARSYIFLPVSRRLLKRGLPSNGVVLTAHLSTMLIIGLWHGVTLNFALWGVWHGLGLFVYKIWNDRTRRHFMTLPPHTQRVIRVVGGLITFHFVVLGWVWFALPETDTALSVFRRLFGL